MDTLTKRMVLKILATGLHYVVYPHGSLLCETETSIIGAINLPVFEEIPCL